MTGRLRSSLILCITLVLLGLSSTSAITLSTEVSSSQVDEISDERILPIMNTTFYSRSIDWMTDIVIASDNSLFAIGYSEIRGFPGGYGTTLAHWNSWGNLVWGLTWYEDVPHIGYGLALGNDGVYLVGEVRPDILVAKFDFNGNRIWNTTIDTGFTETGLGIAVDSNDNIYILGYREGFVSDEWVTQDFLMKLDSSQEIQWMETEPGQRYNPPFRNPLVHPDGHILVSRFGARVGRWTSDGVPNLYPSPLNSSYIQDFTIDSEGAIYGGAYSPSGTFLSKFSSDGELIWKTAIDANSTGLNSTDIEVESFASTGDGSVYLLAKSESPWDQRDRALLLLDSNGELSWKRRVLDESWFISRHCQLLVGTNNLVYIGGTKYNGEVTYIDERGQNEWANRDLALAVFDPTNTQLYSIMRYTPSIVLPVIGVVILAIGFKMRREPRTE